MTRLTRDIALATIGAHEYADPDAWWVRSLRHPHQPPIERDDGRLRFMALHLRGDRGWWWVDPSGNRHGVDESLLNTVIDMGSPPLQLLARLDGYLESHAYVEGVHRAWMGGVIEQGRKLGIMRGGMGWDSIAAMLRARADEPVVCSFSGSGDHSFKGGVEKAMAPLRAIRWLGITPDNLPRQGFGSGKSLFELATMFEGAEVARRGA